MLGSLYVILDLILKIILRGRNITIPILQMKNTEVKRELNNFCSVTQLLRNGAWI